MATAFEVIQKLQSEGYTIDLI